jgi:hypothetical protein
MEVYLMGGPCDLLDKLSYVSTCLHECDKQCFATDDEVEAWEVACGAVDVLRAFVVARMERDAPDDIMKVERVRSISRLISHSEEDENQT